MTEHEKFFLWEFESDNSWKDKTYNIMVYKTIPDLLKSESTDLTEDKDKIQANFSEQDFGKILLQITDIEGQYWDRAPYGYFISSDKIDNLDAYSEKERIVPDSYKFKENSTIYKKCFTSTHIFNETLKYILENYTTIEPSLYCIHFHKGFCSNETTITKQQKLGSKEKEKEKEAKRNKAEEAETTTTTTTTIKISEEFFKEKKNFIDHEIKSRKDEKKDKNTSDKPNKLVIEIWVEDNWTEKNEDIPEYIKNLFNYSENVGGGLKEE
jgi:hypothetical protein